MQDVKADGENIEEINGFVVLVFNFFEMLAQACIFVTLIFSFLFRTVGVEGPSMNNTLQDKDRLLIVSPLLHKPKKKDIVIVNTMDIFDVLIVKRIIAVEGQTVDMKKEGSSYYVYIDGRKIEENYIKEPIDEFCLGDLKYPITIPKGYVFVMGDNRNNSKDSRHIGIVNLEKIKGIALCRFLPFRNFKIFKN